MEHRARHRARQRSEVECIRNETGEIDEGTIPEQDFFRETRNLDCAYRLAPYAARQGTHQRSGAPNRASGRPLTSTRIAKTLPARGCRSSSSGVSRCRAEVTNSVRKSASP